VWYASPLQRARLGGPNLKRAQRYGASPLTKQMQIALPFSDLKARLVVAKWIGLSETSSVAADIPFANKLTTSLSGKSPENVFKPSCPTAPVHRVLSSWGSQISGSGSEKWDTDLNQFKRI
jgi:hypothetical protein